MTRVKSFLMVFSAIFGTIALMSAMFPLAFAFLFWDIKFLFTHEFVMIFWLAIRAEALIVAFMALIISLHPDVREVAYEHKQAKDALKNRVRFKLSDEEEVHPYLKY